MSRCLGYVPGKKLSQPKRSQTELKGRIMEEIEDFFKKDGLAQALGIELEEVGKGFARTSVKLSEKHKNFLGTIHGAAIFALADAAFSAAANSEGKASFATHVGIDYLKRPKGSVIKAECSVNVRGRTAGNYTITVTDENGDLIAICQAWVQATEKSLRESVEI